MKRILVALLLAGCATPPRAHSPDRAGQLVRAVRDDSLAVVKSLLAAGVSPDTIAPDGGRPLTEAARNHRVDAARALLDAGARVDLADATGRRPFDYAVEFGHRDLGVMFIQQLARDGGASAEALQWFADVTNGKRTSHATRVLDGDLLSLGLACAILAEREPVVDELRHAAGRSNVTGYPPLVIAARFGNAAAVSSLLAASANPDGEVAAVPHQTALMEAARDGDIDVARRLLHAGARVDHVDAQGETALMWAVRQGETDYAAVLLAAGADPSHPNTQGLTPLAFARRIDHADLIALLERYQQRPTGLRASVRARA